jgi:hypothetical protein
VVLVLLLAGLTKAFAQTPTFAGNAQHTGFYNVPAQHLQRVCWSTSINLHNTGAYTHYGAPLITPANTVVVPIKTTNGFQICAFEAPTGRLKYTLLTDYAIPPADWGPVYQPVLASAESGIRLYYAGAGGTVYSIDNPDSDTPGDPVQQCFYADLGTYYSNATTFARNTYINTPLTADATGAVFFGFRVLTNAPPAPPGLTNGGFARIDSAGNATFVLATVIANDTRIGRPAQNSAPALSNDGATLYVCVKGTNSDSVSYLVGLDPMTLATKYRVQLVSPGPGALSILDNSTASPVVGPDGDVFFGVYGNFGHGYGLHFSPDLSTQMPPAAFGWDNTLAIVPTNMIPTYSGTSTYLLFSKYNNYAGKTGNGVNCMALLDPHATQLDPHPSPNPTIEMREVLTVIGCTPDSEYQSATYPIAVREWCINTAAVNPATQSVFAPSEDGRLYRWNLALNSLTEVITLGTGLGAPYVPTVVGPDGIIYTLNGGKLFSLGNSTNVTLTISSSAPDLRNVLAGDQVTFTAVATNLDVSGLAPTGTIAFLDLTYSGLKPITNVLSAAVALTNGVATVTTSALIAQSNCLGNHYIIATYSGDTNFSPVTATLVQKVHAYATILNLMSSAPAFGSPVTLTATVSSSPPGGGTPTGMVSFYDGSRFLAQIPLNINGVASFNATNLVGNGKTVFATYNSDTHFASSTGFLVATTPQLALRALLTNGAVQLDFSNIIGAPFTVLSSPDISASSSNWTVLGPALEILPGQFQFTDLQATNTPHEFYRVRSP